jgi:hypothetical protein
MVIKASVSIISHSFDPEKKPHLVFENSAHSTFLLAAAEITQAVPQSKLTQHWKKIPTLNYVPF